MAHKLILKEVVPYRSGHFQCNLCWEKGSGACYHCMNCEFDLHVSCAAITKQQTHFTHFEHPLHLTLDGNTHECDGCGGDINTWIFRCDLCDYDMHSLCARAPRYIMHPSHKHVLSLFDSMKLSGACQCDGCGKRVTAHVYRCRSCNYDLHPYCAAMPLKTKHPKHPEHRLNLLFKPPDGRSSFNCNECGNNGDGWLFRCSHCSYNLHLDCAKISHELPHAATQSSLHENRCMATPAALPTPPNVNNTDVEAMERVLLFVRHLVIDSSPESSREDEHDVCPTCLEGYVSSNPKRSTSCGHHFHLACIMEWLERSNCCPICRKDVKILF